MWNPNEISILTDGPMIQYSEAQIGRFASTGGWILAKKHVTGLYASMDLILLTAEQQSLVEEAATAVYRPCCNSYTLFPDCNHRMVITGLLEVMASQDASADEMFDAQKYVNVYGFLQQTPETSISLQSNVGIDFVDANARIVVSDNLSSASDANMMKGSLQPTAF